MREFGGKEWIRTALDGSSWKPMREAFKQAAADDVYLFLPDRTFLAITYH